MQLPGSMPSIMTLHALATMIGFPFDACSKDLCMSEHVNLVTHKYIPANEELVLANKLVNI